MCVCVCVHTVEQAVSSVLRASGVEDVKSAMRTGTLVTTDNRDWELGVHDFKVCTHTHTHTHVAHVSYLEFVELCEGMTPDACGQSVVVQDSLSKGTYVYA